MEKERFKIRVLVRQAGEVYEVVVSDSICDFVHYRSLSKEESIGIANGIEQVLLAELSKIEQNLAHAKKT